MRSDRVCKTGEPESRASRSPYCLKGGGGHEHGEAPLVRAGLLGVPGSVAVAARPDEVVALAVLGLDQAGVDRRGEARIVQLDGEILALRLAGGLLPGCAQLNFMWCTT